MHICNYKTTTTLFYILLKEACLVIEKNHLQSHCRLQLRVVCHQANSYRSSPWASKFVSLNLHLRKLPRLMQWRICTHMRFGCLRFLGFALPRNQHSEFGCNLSFTGLEDALLPLLVHDEPDICFIPCKHPIVGFCRCHRNVRMWILALDDCNRHVQSSVGQKLRYSAQKR